MFTSFELRVLQNAAAGAFFEIFEVPQFRGYFLYEKTHSSSLKYYKIRKVERKNSASVVWLKGINFPFKIPRPPNADTSWAGVLHLSGIPWILYEYSEFQKSDTRRKV